VLLVPEGLLWVCGAEPEGEVVSGVFWAKTQAADKNKMESRVARAFIGSHASDIDFLLTLRG